MGSTYYVGPRKVTSGGGASATVYLGKRFNHLIGKRVMLIVKVLDEENKS
jgi:putative transposon-encoded protein